ncbi:STAS/SEC14 domain-containing protein [candidate division WOR-3 bacterium]|nr:STAS/SEC14 domain-containing protein [candidate division WOR-3 bacterium]
MRHHVYYDEENEVGVVEVIEEYTVQDADQTFDILDDLFKSKPEDYYYLLVDLTRAIQTLSGTVRKQIQRRSENLDLKRIAMVVTHPAPRMIGKMVVAVMGKSDSTSFFKKKEEALEWLKGDIERDK